MSQPLPSLQHLATKFGLNTTQPQPSSMPNPSLNSTLPNPIAGSSHLRSLKSNHFGPAHAFSHQINPILNSIPQSGPSDEMPKPFAHGPTTRPNPSGPGPRVPPVDGGHPNMPGPRDGPSMGGEMETDEKGECKLCNSHDCQVMYLCLFLWPIDQKVWIGHPNPGDCLSRRCGCIRRNFGH